MFLFFHSHKKKNKNNQTQTKTNTAAAIDDRVEVKLCEHLRGPRDPVVWPTRVIVNSRNRDRIKVFSLRPMMTADVIGAKRNVKS